MPVFEVHDVVKSFPGTPPVVALSDVSLSIGPGEFVCLLGPSGCGKSTLLEILAGLQQPSSGSVEFNGAELLGPQPGLAVVFQDASLYPWRTVLDNVAIGLEIQGVGTAERREFARRHLELVGLSEFADKFPHHLSGGMRQRAGIARALTVSPDVLLMDEPFGAVDHLTRIRLQQDLLRIWQQTGKTVVFVTHDVGEAVFLADQVVLLSARPGRVFRTFDIDLPRPRKHGEIDLLKQESEIYAALDEMDAAE
ncbi:ABC transporter ATP-binding protein [Saccharopolyspora sp. 5N102]|uniref:ABC transporter ATP-binding protein n=1 Tax=Saccharopolyspora sp. 5N102 TaxID=3375155 RepID=UPI003796CBEF